jgi:hypothetical protein
MKIRIGQYAFSIGSPFASGHVLSANEAEAMNRLRAENIRNNVKKWVDQERARCAVGELLTPDALSELQDKISAYAASYQFGVIGEPKGGLRRTPFEQELRAVALERVELQMRQMEIELSAEALELALEQQMKLAPVVEEARRRVKARQELAAQALEELL